MMPTEILGVVADEPIYKVSEVNVLLWRADVRRVEVQRPFPIAFEVVGNEDRALTIPGVENAGPVLAAYFPTLDSETGDQVVQVFTRPLGTLGPPSIDTLYRVAAHIVLHELHEAFLVDGAVFRSDLVDAEHGIYSLDGARKLRGYATSNIHEPRELLPSELSALRDRIPGVAAWNPGSRTWRGFHWHARMEEVARMAGIPESV